MKLIKKHNSNDVLIIEKPYMKYEFTYDGIWNVYLKKGYDNRANYILIFLNISSKIVTNSRKAMMPEFSFYSKSDNNNAKRKIFAK